MTLARYDIAASNGDNAYAYGIAAARAAARQLVADAGTGRATVTREGDRHAIGYARLDERGNLEWRSTDLERAHR